MKNNLIIQFIIAFLLGGAIVITGLLVWCLAWDNVQVWLDVVDANPAVSGLSILAIGSATFLYLGRKS